jgi:hypothetical protein
MPRHDLLRAFAVRRRYQREIASERPIRLRIARAGKLLIGLALTCCPVFAYCDPQYPMCIRNEEHVALSPADTQRILTASSALLTRQGSSACHSISLTLETLKPYTTEYPPTLGLSSQFAEFAVDPCVKVVKRIIWCGTTLATSGSFLGCAAVGRRGMVVIRSPTSDAALNEAVEPVTWLHEFGHSVGLTHNVDPTDVMAMRIGPPTNRLTDSECSAYRKPIVSTGGAVSGSEALTAVGQSSKSKTEPPPSLEQFVREFNAGAFPVARALRYKDESAKAISLLSDPTFENYRPNIVALLGVIGTPSALPTLASIMRTPLSHHPPEVDVNVRLAAPIAIGSIANRYKLTPEHFDILKAGLEREFWEAIVAPAKTNSTSPESLALPANALRLRGEALDKRSADALIGDFVSQTYRAYALTGSNDAAIELERRRHMPQASFPFGGESTEQALRDQKALIDDAQALQKKSAEKGALSSYH